MAYDRPMLKGVQLVGLLFAFSPCVVRGETATVSLGGAGVLTVEYEVASGGNISGTITNSTKLPIHCGSVWPVINGEREYIRTLIGLKLSAGESKIFSEHFVGRATKGLGSTLQWKEALCITPLVYDFVNGTIVKSLSLGVITGTIGTKQIQLSVELEKSNNL
jgi:hypothetical protein